MATPSAKGKGKGTGFRAPTAISMRPQEEWSAEPLTESRVIELAKKIVKGESRATVQEYAKKNYNIQDRQARAYYEAAMRYLMPPKQEEQRNQLIEVNLRRLETIVEKTMKGNDYKNAIAAIKEINSMIAPPKNEIKIGKQGDTEIIQISFD